MIDDIQNALAPLVSMLAQLEREHASRAAPLREAIAELTRMKVARLKAAGKEIPIEGAEQKSQSRGRAKFEVGDTVRFLGHPWKIVGGPFIRYGVTHPLEAGVTSADEKELTPYP